MGYSGDKMTRKYKTGTKWCFWRWTDTHSEYITRLHFIKTPWFAICLHWINKPDAEPYLHDHPVSFLSLILKGGYKEYRKVGPPEGVNLFMVKEHTWFNFIKASNEDAHRIIEVKPKTLTICFMGPKIRDWGFHTENGWLYWKNYNKEVYEQKN